MIKPGLLRLILISFIILLLGGVTALMLLNPLPDLLRGREMEAIREQAIVNTMRVRQLEDSLRAQQAYAATVAELLGLQSATAEAEDRPSTDTGATEEASPLHPSESTPLNWADHEQPAVPVDRMAAVAVPSDETRAIARGYLSGLQLPFLPPVDGFVTRGFSARDGHFAVDIAVKSGSIVRSIGDGHVIVADWGYDGGWTLAVHHAGGYVSVFKHSDRLLKRVGERVLDREPVAISGNTGEITTGPHIHFELWHEGLAQDPERYFLK